jgi:hypothetical protein
MLIYSLLEAGDLLSQVVDLVFEVFLPAANTGVSGFHEGAEAVYGIDHASAQETRGDVEAAERRLAGGTCGRGGRERANGETADGPDGCPEHEFSGSLAQNRDPSGTFELRRRKFSTAPACEAYVGYGGLY